MKHGILRYLTFGVLVALLLTGCGSISGSGMDDWSDSGGSGVTPPPIEPPTTLMSAAEYQAFFSERLVELVVGQAGLILTAASGSYAYNQLGMDVATVASLEAFGFDPAQPETYCSISTLHEGDQDGDGLPFRGYELNCSGSGGAYAYAAFGAADTGDRWDNDSADTSFWIVPSSLSSVGSTQVMMYDPTEPLQPTAAAVLISYLAAPTAPSASFEYTSYNIFGASYGNANLQPGYVAITPDASYPLQDTTQFRYDADNPGDPWQGGTVTPLPNVPYTWSSGTDATSSEIAFHVESLAGNPLHWSRTCASSQGRYGFDRGGVRFVATDGTVLATAQFFGCGRPTVTVN